MTAPRPPHFSMLREFTFADLLTMGNAACGTASMFVCLQYLAEGERRYLWTAFVLLPVAFVLDGLDGIVARKQKRQSRLGADLDSLSDVISFGVAPAVLAYTLGMRGGWDVAVLLYFVLCGVSRLARFNVTASALSDESGKVKYFEGTPIPTSLALVLLLGLAFRVDAVHEALWGGVWRLGPAALHPLVLLWLLSGSLMISATLRIPKP